MTAAFLHTLLRSPTCTPIRNQIIREGKQYPDRRPLARLFRLHEEEESH